jgi:hypothetical protein
MNLHRRLETLEKRHSNAILEPTILIMPNGTTATIDGDGDYLLQLLSVAVNDEHISAGQAKQLDLIRRSMEAREPNGAHLTDLIRSILNSPADGLDVILVT